MKYFTLGRERTLTTLFTPARKQPFFKCTKPLRKAGPVRNGIEDRGAQTSLPGGTCRC